jgi:hypothetical protein
MSVVNVLVLIFAIGCVVLVIRSVRQDESEDPTPPPPEPPPPTGEEFPAMRDRWAPPDDEEDEGGVPAPPTRRNP